MWPRPPDTEAPAVFQAHAATRLLAHPLMIDTKGQQAYDDAPMAARIEEEQTEHDLVIEAALEQFAGSAKYALHANPGTEQNVAVGHQYPDIVVTERGSSKVRFLIEVETTGTVGDQELNHWRALSMLGPPFYMLTPYAATADAARLCTNAGIKCHNGFYVKDELGRFKVVLKKDSASPSRVLHH